MNLNDLADHICEQCGMVEAEDTAAAKLFLQRRLQMIWDSQLWRSSLVEATMTLDPDGTSTLAGSVWIPSRGTLLLPSVIQRVLAARTDAHTLSVATLESYHRTDSNRLDLSGDPTEFQVLSPAVWEAAAAIGLYTYYADSGDAAKDITLLLSEDGVTRTTSVINPTATGLPSAFKTRTAVDTARIVFSANKAATTGDITVKDGAHTALIPSDATYSDERTGTYDITGLRNGTTYTWTAGNAVFLFETTPEAVVTAILPGDFTVNSANTYTLQGPTNVNPVGPYDPVLITATVAVKTNVLFTIAAAAHTADVRQRIRLTGMPSVATTLRVLGKIACPVLGEYDDIPINGAEPALIAFGRGDMLLRQRQHGKAQIALQEGAMLLAALARAETFQQASRNQIVPDNGFGDEAVCSCGSPFCSA